MEEAKALVAQTGVYEGQDLDLKAAWSFSIEIVEDLWVWRHYIYIDWAKASDFAPLDQTKH